MEEDQTLLSGGVRTRSIDQLITPLFDGRGLFVSKQSDSKKESAGRMGLKKGSGGRERGTGRVTMVWCYGCGGGGWVLRSGVCTRGAPSGTKAD